ncbi:MAG TPA: hypothetical protein VLL97_12205 [Acidobacteriota bacterium]|nr:hypothetical protein [Acidobacteriota bacterium]
MFLLIDIWLLPAIAAGSSSYMICLLWERIRRRSAPGWWLSIFLAIMSFLMGGICAFCRHMIFAPTLENNIIIMFLVGASTTFFWLLMRKYLPRSNLRGDSR